VKKATWSILVAIDLLIGISYAQVLVDPETRGVWAPAGFSPKDSASIEAMIRNLSSANFNVIYVGVWDGHSINAGTIYPSTVVKNAGGPLQYPDFVGTDPLRTYIDIAHRYGMEVIAWFELMPFDISVNSDSTNLPLLLKANPTWAMVQRDTTKRGYHHEIYGYYFGIDPAVSSAASFVVDLYTECARNYPDLDGIESDIENDTTFSYSDTARFRFMQETGNPDPLTLPANNAAWLAWRRLQVTNIVKEIYENVKKVNPQCVVAAAVAPPAWGQFKYLEQWDEWANKSYIDIVEPMLYVPPGDFDYELKGCLSYVPPGFKLSAGISATDGNSVQDAISEIQDARSNGVAGEVIWYYTPVSTANALAALKSGAFASKTLPSYDDLLMDNGSAGLFATIGQWVTKPGGYNGSYVASEAVEGDTAIFTVRVLRSGRYSLYGYWSGDSATNCSTVLVNTSTAKFSKQDTVNQKINMNVWAYVDKFWLDSGDTVRIKLSGTGAGYIIGDAFRLRRVSSFTLIDYAVPDSESILFKFSNRLLTPLPSVTRVTTSIGNNGISYYVDPLDNTVFHITTPPLTRGLELTVRVDSILDVFYDTLNVVQTISYDPDSTTFIIDDKSSGLFWKLSGVWIEDSSYDAVGGEYWSIKQGSIVARAQWGPQQVKLDGYYDVYVNVPDVTIPLTDKCLYIVRDHFGVDSIYISQSSARGQWFKLGNFPYKAGDQFAVMVSSVVGSDTSKYLIADAVKIMRSVQVTGIKGDIYNLANEFKLSDNYPNPFNPSTNIKVTLGHSGLIALKIYNVLGQLVKVVDEGYKTAGEYVYHVNMDKFGSGVYFYRLQEGGIMITKKMILVK
jgi:uncharacterized lipoprotein YddW (UPF0748 family)